MSRSCPRLLEAGSAHRNTSGVVLTGHDQRAVGRSFARWSIPLSDPTTAIRTCVCWDSTERSARLAGFVASTSQDRGTFNKYKVVTPASRGHLGKFGKEPALILGEPLLGEPQVAVTQTFITIGSFGTKAEAEACLKYVKSKFARTMLGVLKVTQHNPASTWKYVPLQDFTASSDIEWSRPIPEIDQQLYAKYGLDADEIAFIEAKIKPME
jgi:hypothetical protein